MKKTIPVDIVIKVRFIFEITDKISIDKFQQII